MSVFDKLATLAEAGKAVDAAAKARRERVREALRALVRGLRSLEEGVARDHADSHVDAVLAASSQTGAILDLAKAAGLPDALRGLVDRLDGGAK